MCGSGIVPGRCACEKEKATRNARSPLNASARRALSAYLQLRPKAQPGESLFLSDRNGAFSPRAVQTLLQTLGASSQDRAPARDSSPGETHLCPELFASESRQAAADQRCDRVYLCYDLSIRGG